MSGSVWAYSTKFKKKRGGVALRHALAKPPLCCLTPSRSKRAERVDLFRRERYIQGWVTGSAGVHSTQNKALKVKPSACMRCTHGIPPNTHTREAYTYPPPPTAPPPPPAPRPPPPRRPPPPPNWTMVALLGFFSCVPVVIGEGWGQPGRKRRSDERGGRRHTQHDPSSSRAATDQQPTNSAPRHPQHTVGCVCLQSCCPMHVVTHKTQHQAGARGPSSHAFPLGWGSLLPSRPPSRNSASEESREQASGVRCRPGMQDRAAHKI